MRVDVHQQIVAPAGRLSLLGRFCRLIYVMMTYMTQFETEQLEASEARRRLVEAETEYQRARSEDYVALLIRDSAIVDAHRSGLSSREISELVGDMGQPNVVRARRRSVARREIVPDGLLSPADAIRASGLSPKDFIDLVRQRELKPVELAGGVRAFRPEDIEHLRTGA